MLGNFQANEGFVCVHDPHRKFYYKLKTEKVGDFCEKLKQWMIIHKQI